jgi:hypothetical protein
LRSRLAELEAAAPALVFDVDAGIEEAFEALSVNTSERARLVQQIQHLETLTTEATRREKAARAARRADLVDELKTTLAELDDAKRHAIEQAAFAFAAWKEKALSAAMAASLAYSLAENLLALTGDQRFRRIYHLEFRDISREDQAERFRTMLRHEVRDRRKAAAAPAWQKLIEAARSLSLPPPITDETSSAPAETPASEPA